MSYAEASKNRISNGHLNCFVTATSDKKVYVHRCNIFTKYTILFVKSYLSFSIKYMLHVTVRWISYFSFSSNDYWQLNKISFRRGFFHFFVGLRCWYHTVVSIAVRQPLLQRINFLHAYKTRQCRSIQSRKYSCP